MEATIQCHITHSMLLCCSIGLFPNKVHILCVELTLTFTSTFQLIENQYLKRSKMRTYSNNTSGASYFRWFGEQMITKRRDYGPSDYGKTTITKKKAKYKTNVRKSFSLYMQQKTITYAFSESCRDWLWWICTDFRTISFIIACVQQPLGELHQTALVHCPHQSAMVVAAWDECTLNAFFMIPAASSMQNTLAGLKVGAQNQRHVILG